MHYTPLPLYFATLWADPQLLHYTPLPLYFATFWADSQLLHYTPLPLHFATLWADPQLMHYTPLHFATLFSRNRRLMEVVKTHKWTVHHCIFHALCWSEMNCTSLYFAMNCASLYFTINCVLQWTLHHCVLQWTVHHSVLQWTVHHCVLQWTVHQCILQALHWSAVWLRGEIVRAARVTPISFAKETCAVSIYSHFCSRTAIRV